jgi:uncharacterized protein YbjT (DUF2867 family)
MKKGQDTIVVTGATGHQGGAVARELLAKGHKVKAMTRKPASPAAVALKARGAEVVQGDLDDAASLEQLLRGAWGVFAVQNTWEAGVAKEEEQGHRLVKLARQQGVQHFVYTSVGSAQRKTGIPHFDNKARIEQSVRSEGFPSWVIIRPVFFMENFLSPWAKPAIDQGQLMLAIQPTTKLQMIAVSDIGKYGALAFAEAARMNGKEIDLAGDEKTMPETAAVFSKAAGRTVTFQQVPIQEVRTVSADQAVMLEWFDRVGYNADIKKNEQEYGIRATPLNEWAKALK